MSEKIALGLGDNIDYEIVWDSEVFEKLIVHHNICAGELSVDRPIDSERDLVISILSFLKAGIGGERWVANSAIVENFAHYFEMKVTLGGTSVRAAIAMRKLGYTSALHLVTINDHVRSLIPSDSPYVCSSAADSSYPHLIVQFRQNTRIDAGDIQILSKRANRIIYHDDRDNISMLLNEEFSRLITDAKVLLISGFNAMHDRTLLLQRLDSLLRIMQCLPHDALVFYEDAGFYDPRFNQVIHGALIGKISIISLNDDELQAHLGRELDLLDVLQIRDALVDLHKLISAPIIVVHTMYWALAYGDDARTLCRALKGGVTMATTRFCYGDEFTVEDYRYVEGLAPNQAGASFANAMQALLDEQVCCIPVARVDQSNGTTIGLGDAFVGGFLPALLSA